jgi:hypothetical protein
VSRDYHLLIDTEMTPQALRDKLIAGTHLTAGEGGWLAGSAVTLIVNPATLRDTVLAEPAIDRATIRVKLIPNTKRAVDPPMRELHQLVARILGWCAGDAAFTAQDTGTALLRKGAVVYVDPLQLPNAWLEPSDLARDLWVEGIP